MKTIKLFAALLMIVIIANNASASIWIDNTEIGLSQYQSSGYVGDKHIIREEFSNIKNIYIESARISIMYSVDGYRKLTVNGNEFYIYDKDIKIDMGV